MPTPLVYTDNPDIVCAGASNRAGEWFIKFTKRGELFAGTVERRVSETTSGGNVSVHGINCNITIVWN